MVFQAVTLEPLRWPGESFGVGLSCQIGGWVAIDRKATGVFSVGSDHTRDALASFRKATLILRVSLGARHDNRKGEEQRDDQATHDEPPRR